MPDVGCLGGQLLAWLPLLSTSAVLLLLKLAIFQPRLRRLGSPIPEVASLGSLLRHGRYRGVPVVEEPPTRFGGGRYLRVGARGQIRLDQGMLVRRDVDALAILEHERGHADRDLPAPRAYRLALVGAFLMALALGLGNPALGPLATTVMWGAFALAALHFMRNELAASEYAVRQIWTRGWPRSLWREAITRLGAALALYVADWTGFAAIMAGLASLVACRV